MAEYKWATPYQWLVDKAQTMTEVELRSTMLQIACMHDSDTLQDLFQTEMDNDGYFNEIE